jgi:hypothetical protein
MQFWGDLHRFSKDFERFMHYSMGRSREVVKAVRNAAKVELEMLDIQNSHQDILSGLPVGFTLKVLEGLNGECGKLSTHPVQC